MKKYLIMITLLIGLLFATQTYDLKGLTTGTTYYVSPTGNDNNSGTSTNQPWATFDRAWKDIYPGDTLVLMDGIYYQSLRPNKRNGEPGNPITIRALNDGKAIVDGQYARTPVQLGDTWPGPIGNYFVVEGIVARNSIEHVYNIRGSHNVLRRVSGYNANPNTNATVFAMIWSDNNLIEDCAAGGSGRKMIMIFEAEYNTVRRCVANWGSWDGRDFCGVSWPNGGNIHIYNASNNTVENSIALGPIPKWSVLIQANYGGAQAINNKILGTISLQAGMNPNGTVKDWGTGRPQPTTCTGITDFGWPSHRVGFMLYGQGLLQNNLYQDIFSWGNAGYGLSFIGGPDLHPNNANNRVNHATVYGNGLDNPDGPWPGAYGGIGADMRLSELNGFTNVTNSNIQNVFVEWPNYPNGQKVFTSLNGPGARLTNRYVNGVLTAESLWPWPMEARIQSEMGLSISNDVLAIVQPNPDFVLNVSPEALALIPGGSATVQVQVQPVAGFDENVTVSLTNPAPSSLSLTGNIPSANTGLPLQFNLTIRDLHDGSLNGALLYQVPITVQSASGDIVHEATVMILVNGQETFLPVVRR